MTGHDAALRAFARIRPALFRAIAAAPPGWAMGLSAGDATARFVRDVEQVEAAFVRRPSAWGGVAACASGLALLVSRAGWQRGRGAHHWRADPWRTMRWRQAERRGRAVPAASGALAAEVAALLAAAPELRAYGLERLGFRPHWRANPRRSPGRKPAATAARLWFELLQSACMGLAAAAHC